MKKIVAVMMVCMMVFALTACGGAEPTEEENSAASGGAAGTGSEAALVVYFSWSGNTESVASEIQKQTGADIFRLVPEEPYTDDYDTLLEVAEKEQRDDARPEISGSIDHFDDYRVVYLGFPIWWGDMPMILYSFLDDYDLSGKTIVPFVTSGGSGFSGAIQTIEGLEPEAEVLKGLSLGSTEAAEPGSAVSDWLKELGLAQ